MGYVIGSRQFVLQKQTQRRPFNSHPAPRQVSLWQQDKLWAVQNRSRASAPATEPRSHPAGLQRSPQHTKGLLLDETLISCPLFVLWETSFGVVHLHFSPVLSVNEKIVCFVTHFCLRMSAHVTVWKKQSLPSCEVSCIAKVLLLSGYLTYILVFKPPKWNLCKSQRT